MRPTERAWFVSPPRRLMDAGNAHGRAAMMLWEADRAGSDRRADSLLHNSLYRHRGFRC
jgi:hypothetical protein